MPMARRSSLNLSEVRMDYSIYVLSCQTCLNVVDWFHRERPSGYNESFLIIAIYFEMITERKIVCRQKVCKQKKT